MSHTDKTDPWWVKENDPRLFYIYNSQPAFPGTKWPKWWIGESLCGCKMCTDQDNRRIERRKERRAGKIYCYDKWIEEYGEDWAG